MKKTLMSLVVLIVALTCFNFTVMADENVNVVLDGETIIFDVPAQIINGRTMVPMRKIFESMGATVDWNNDTQTIIAQKKDITVIMQINNYVITVNGDNVMLDVPPQLVNSRTLVPARAVAESFNANVNWDGNTSTVFITTKYENNDIEAQEIITKNDFVNYIIKNGQKTTDCYLLGKVFTENSEALFMYYYPESTKMMLGYHYEQNKNTFDVVFTLGDDPKKCSYSCISSTNSNGEKFDYIYNGTFNIYLLNENYLPEVTDFSKTLNNVDVTHVNSSQNKEAIEVGKSTIASALVEIMNQSITHFNLNIKNFDFDSVVSTANSKSEITPKENNVLQYENEYNSLIEWANQKTNEITEEAEKIYNETIETEKKRYFSNYGNSNLDSYAAYNTQRQLDALMPIIKQSAELASKAYEAEALENLANFLQEQIADLKQKYNIKN